MLDRLRVSAPFLALCLLSALPAQVSDPGDDAKAWLRFLDGRIYSQPDLAALSFRFRPRYPGIDGGATRPAPYVVSYKWKKGLGDRVDLLGVDPGTKGLVAIPRLPGHSDAQQAQVLSDFRDVGRSFGQVIRGMTLEKQYADFRGRVRRTTINDAEEITLVLEPQKAHRLTRVVMHLNRNRIPWKLDKVYRSGDRVSQHHTYEKRDPGFVVTKVTRDHTPAVPSQPSFDTAFVLTWQTVGGVLLPASIERLGRGLPEVAKGKTAFSSMRINDDVVAFEPMPEPKKSAGRDTREKKAGGR